VDMCTVILSFLVTEKTDFIGAQVFEGHASANMVGADVVVISSAVKADNPE